MKPNQENASKVEKLAVAPTAFNLLGALQTSAEFDLPLDFLNSKITDFANQYLGDVHKVSFEANSKTGHVDTYLWLPQNSPNLVDNSAANTQGAAIKKTITKYSDELKKFMERFCQKEDRRIYSEDGNQPYRAIKISLQKIFEVMFDVYGNEYNKLYGRQPRTEIVMCGRFLNAKENGYDKLISIYVKKQEKTRNSGNLRARKNLRI